MSKNGRAGLRRVAELRWAIEAWCVGTTEQSHRCPRQSARKIPRGSGGVNATARRFIPIPRERLAHRVACRDAALRSREQCFYARELRFGFASNVSMLPSSVSMLPSSVSMLPSCVSVLASCVSDLGSCVSDLRSSVSHLRSSVSELASSVSELPSSVSELASRFSQLTSGG